MSTQMLELEQGSKEWLEFRKDKVGASDAPAIMGVDQWITPYKKWKEKLEGETFIPNNAMKRGIMLEPYARRYAEMKLEMDLKPCVRLHRTIPYMMASLDGINKDGKTTVEIKCPTTPRFKEVPEMYYPQLQHQLEVNELEKMYYVNFMPKNEYEFLEQQDLQFVIDIMGFWEIVDHENSWIIEINRCDSYINELLQKEAEFWECLQKRIPPPSKETNVEVIEDAAFCASAARLLECQTKKKELEKDEERERNFLLSFVKEKNIKGGGISISKVVRKGAVDYDNIPILKGIDLEAHRKAPSESWRITHY